MIRRVFLLTACIALATFAQACGPDFFPDVFVRTTRPDLPKRYVGGHLGILQTGFASADLFVAYRYLDGGALSPAEQAGWSPTPSVAEQEYGEQQSVQDTATPEPEASLKAWQEIRAKYPNAPTPVNPNLNENVTTSQGYTYSSSFPNCAADAFRTAISTLQDRAGKWGKSSPWLTNWLQGQDAVFASCSTSTPAPQLAPADSPLLLKQDRAYQQAAAHFYARDFDTAEQEFVSIAADRSSPWSTTAGYVAARVLIRKSFLAIKNAQAPADFEPKTMQAAERQIRAFLSTDPPAPWKRAALGQFALVRIRLEPEVRTRELAALVAGPKEDTNYAQDVRDLRWVMAYRLPDGLRASAQNWEQTKLPDGTSGTRLISAAEGEQQAKGKRDEAYQQSAAFRLSAAMLDWTVTLRALSTNNAAHALDQWRNTKSLPWLVAALMLAPDSARPDEALLQAAASVPQDSPAWQTVTYHRARLQTAAGALEAARSTIALLQSALDRLPVDQREPSSVNAVRGLAMRAAEQRPLLLSHLSRTLLLAASEPAVASTACEEVMKQPGDWHHCIAPGKNEIDTDGARFLNEQAPLSVWVEAANSPVVPQPLRGAIAMQGWTRAVLLKDKAAAGALQPLLPKLLQQELSSTSRLMPWMVLVRNPGLQPYVDPGVQRAYSYDFVESYRLNWCYNPADYATASRVPTALAQEEAKTGAAQAGQLQSIRAVEAGQKLIDAVQANPSDAKAPEALYLVLRMIRYGCNPVKEPGAALDFSSGDPRPDLHTGEKLLQLRRDTARLMRRYYATSDWTKKAAPFVGEVHPPATR